MKPGSHVRVNRPSSTFFNQIGVVVPILRRPLPFDAGRVFVKLPDWEHPLSYSPSELELVERDWIRV